MFRIHMALHKSSDRWEFRVGWVFRAILAVLAVGILYAGFRWGSGSVAAVIALIAMVGAVYEESMSFDRARGVAEFRTGLLFLHRRKVFALGEIAQVRVSVFGPARFTGLEIVLADGSGKTIESDRGEASVRRLQQWGAELAEWLEIPLTGS